MHPPSAARFRLVLAKEDFKFSAAHFTLLPEFRSELLHGHNYRVRLELVGAGLDEEGLLIDVERLKKHVRAACARLDSRTLLPAQSTRLEWREVGAEIEVRLGERRYLIPQADVLMLPLVNTSMELLAGMLWRELLPRVAGGRIEWFCVSVEEAAGQRCSYEGAVG